MLTQLKKLFRSERVLPSFEVADETFPYLEIHASEDASPVLLIGLHGFGSDETQIASLVDLEPPFPFVYLAPRGWYTLTDGGYAWFPLERSGDTFTVDRAQHLESLDLLELFITEAMQHYGAKEVYLVGYSQGASLSLSYYLHKPKTVFGAVVMSGTLLPEMKPEELRTARYEGKPLFVGQGTSDTFISEKDRLELRRYLGGLSVPLTHREYPAPHVVSREELRDVEGWLEEFRGSGTPKLQGHRQSPDQADRVFVSSSSSKPFSDSKLSSPTSRS